MYQAPIMAMGAFLIMDTAHKVEGPIYERRTIHGIL